MFGWNFKEKMIEERSFQWGEDGESWSKKWLKLEAGGNKRLQGQGYYYIDYFESDFKKDRKLMLVLKIKGNVSWIWIKAEWWYSGRNKEKEEGGRRKEEDTKRKLFAWLRRLPKLRYILYFGSTSRWRESIRIELMS